MESFQKPLFQTFGMFVGMCFGLVMHWIVLVFQLPFPGYDFGNNGSSGENGQGDVEIPTEKTSLVKGSNKGENQKEGEDGDAALGDAAASSREIPTWMYFFLAIPAVFDLAATALW